MTLTFAEIRDELEMGSDFMEDYSWSDAAELVGFLMQVVYHIRELSGELEIADTDGVIAFLKPSEQDGAGVDIHDEELFKFILALFATHADDL